MDASGRDKRETRGRIHHRTRAARVGTAVRFRSEFLVRGRVKGIVPPRVRKPWALYVY